MVHGPLRLSKLQPTHKLVFLDRPGNLWVGDDIWRRPGFDHLCERLTGLLPELPENKSYT
jgi:hypothetical protein